MTDFETAARRALDEPVFPPTHPDRIRQRAARLRRRRRTRLASLSAAALAAAVAVAVALWAALPGPSGSQVVATGPPTPTTTKGPPPGPALPAGWQPASAGQVDAFAARIASQPSLDYQATWSVTLLASRTGPHHATVVSAADTHGWFYKLTPASAFSTLPSPPGLTTTGAPGTSYAYYQHLSGKPLSASCTTSPQPPHAWHCVSWAGQNLGMNSTFQLQSPSPPYSSYSGVTNAILHYGYNNPGGGANPTMPAYITHRRQFGLELTCLRFGPVRHPAGRVCADQHGFVTSYQFPPAASVSTPYTSLTLTSYHPNPPTSILNPPTTPTGPN